VFTQCVGYKEVSMIRTFLNAKIHGCVCTDVDLDYEGSILIDEDWMDEVGLLIHEQVDVYNKTNGNRHTTYVLPLPRGSNEVSVNGAGAHLTEVGDELIICSYIQLDDNMETLQQGKLVHEPTVKIIDPKDKLYRELLGLN
tara:strand:- start:402 stop:824 length:423 start_codon:yes stop_codon:yes gene_type:complete